MAAKINAKDSTVAQQEEYRRIQAMADTYTKEELKEMFKRFDVKSPITGNDLSDPVDFNMMFKSEIGPTGDNPG